MLVKRENTVFALEITNCARMFAMENFSEWLNNELEVRDWSQADLVREAGIARGTVSNILSGTKGVGEDTLNAISRAFKIPPAEVFRAAGLLPPDPDNDETLDRIEHLYNALKDPA